MCTFERKRGLFVVVEKGRLPLRAVMAMGALTSSNLGKLLPVDICMARSASDRSEFEIYLHESSPWISRFMAIGTLRSFVGAL